MENGMVITDFQISRIGEIGRIRIARIEQHTDLRDSPDRFDLDTSNISDTTDPQPRFPGTARDSSVDAQKLLFVQTKNPTQNCSHTNISTAVEANTRISCHSTNRPKGFPHRAGLVCLGRWHRETRAFLCR